MSETISQANSDISKIFDKLQTIYSATFKELMREIQKYSKERAELCERVWVSHNWLIKQLILEQQRQHDHIQDQDLHSMQKISQILEKKNKEY